jgi:hypothetical protein
VAAAEVWKLIQIMLIMQPAASTEVQRNDQHQGV